MAFYLAKRVSPTGAMLPSFSLTVNIRELNRREARLSLVLYMNSLKLSSDKLDCTGK